LSSFNLFKSPSPKASKSGVRMSKVAGPAKKTSTVAEPPGQYTWRVRRKLDGADTPWKSGGPAEIMEVVLRRLEVLENFEKSTKEIERRINNLDKNILAVAKEIMPLDVEQFMPKPPKEPTPPPKTETIMPRPPGAPPPPKEPVITAKGAAPVAAAAGAAGVKAGVKPEDAKREALATTSGLLQQVQAPASANTPQKVSIIGAGPVGINLAFAVLNQGIATEIAIVDSDASKLTAEAMDMQYGQGFVHNAKVVGSSDVAVTANSRLVVLTVGQGDGKMAPADLAQKNIAAYKVIIPKILEKSPNCNLLVVSNPVDVMTYAAWKISGLPPHRVIGSGTNLDSNRFRGLIADRLKLNTADCHGWIIGQQGAKSIPVWSAIHVAGVNLKGLNPAIGGAQDKENWKACHQEVVAAANEIVKAKRTASMGLAMSLASIVRSMLHNSREVFAVSTMVKGYHGLADEVFLSLPCVLGDYGVCDVIKQPLAPEEVKLLQTGTAELKAALAALKF